MSSHHHSHDHGDHSHDHHHSGPVSADGRRERRLLYAFGLTAITLVVEAVGGWISGSLALLADAGHMLVDAAALMFAWLGIWFARRPADSLRSFGYARLEVLVGYTNSLSQILLVAWIGYEAVVRFVQPAPILSGMMLAVASAGLMVNLFVLRVLGGHDHDDLNTAAARLHVVGDLLGSLGAVAAALVVRYFGWLWADPLISILVSLLLLNSAWHLLRRSAHILLEGVPEGLDVDVLRRDIESAIAGVREIHHVHVWQLSGGQRMATLHARLDDDLASDQAIRSIQELLKARFAVSHATVQIDAGDCAPGGCNGAPCASNR
ncbi:MAG: cation diffusion facilitator family transporter [Dokdonella sp.]|uniref:cation diffusion facilitator family transporter n=1 Tax=Dokdonella sp. TaxID=2291710 RepID=UPI002C14A898|nr:cation diffusion facilitator family transporter [Dokdonella sp.]HOX72211.1 cation diffusion facilitator family transporter [Dokdonella sp.]HPG95108.1 cation diffusion facilitator family transporter [Dokdonella sp.]